MELLGYRTIIRPGMGQEYSRVHAQVPEPLEQALLEAGVVAWRIWRDDHTLFHTIETRNGRDAMLAAMATLGPIDPVWDALITTLIDSEPESQTVLPLVWELTTAGQRSGTATTSIIAKE